MNKLKRWVRKIINKLNIGIIPNIKTVLIIKIEYNQILD